MIVVRNTLVLMKKLVLTMLQEEQIGSLKYCTITSKEVKVHIFGSSEIMLQKLLQSIATFLPRCSRPSAPPPASPPPFSSPSGGSQDEELAGKSGGAEEEDEEGGGEEVKNFPPSQPPLNCTPFLFSLLAHPSLHIP